MSNPIEESSPQLTAMIDLIGRTGANDYQIQCDAQSEPTVWNALSRHGEIWTVGAGFGPHEATYTLLEKLIDGGMCTSCHKPTGVTMDVDEMPMDEIVCWYQYDPELETMRKGCASNG